MYMLNMVIILIVMYCNVVTAIDKIPTYLLCFNTPHLLVPCSLTLSHPIDPHWSHPFHPCLTHSHSHSLLTSNQQSNGCILVTIQQRANSVLDQSHTDTLTSCYDKDLHDRFLFYFMYWYWSHSDSRFIFLLASGPIRVVDSLLVLLTHAQLTVMTQSCALLYTAAHCDLLLQWRYCSCDAYCSCYLLFSYSI